MIPPTSIDGTDITGATIDGTDVTEITVDGDTVFTAVPGPGSHFYHAESLGDVKHFDLSTPFDISNLGSPEGTLTYPTGVGIAVRNDGSQFIGGGENQVWECYDLNTPYNFSGGTSLAYTATNVPTGVNNLYTCLEIVEDDKLYLGTGANELTQYDLSTPFDIRTRTQTGTHTFNASADQIGDPAFSPDGTKLTVGTRKDNKIIQSTCSTPFDITTFDDNNANVFTTNDSDPLTVKWNGDGTQFFVRHLSPEFTDRYDVSTPYTLNNVTNQTRLLPDIFSNGTIEFNYSV